MFNTRSSFTKFQGASKSTFMLFCSNFYVVLFFLFLKFVINFEILCQDDEFTLKFEFTL